jgi:hypothetical protein
MGVWNIQRVREFPGGILVAVDTLPAERLIAGPAKIKPMNFIF